MPYTLKSLWFIDDKLFKFVYKYDVIHVQEHKCIKKSTICELITAYSENN